MTPSSQPLISMDLGGTKLLGVLIDSDNQIITRQRRSTPRGKEAVTGTILRLIGDLSAAASERKLTPDGIALCAPGFVNTHAGMIVDADNLAVDNLSIVQAIEDRFHIPSRLFHDVKSATLAEALYGAGIGRKNFALLNLGTGVAVGLYLDGKIYQGSSSRSGEIGHAALQPAGPGVIPGLGQRLEAFASGPAMARRAAEAIALHPSPVVAQSFGGDPAQVTPHLIQEAAVQGEAWALGLIEASADAIGLVVGAMQDLLDLECIILNGGVAQMGETISAPIQAAVNRYTIDPVPVIPSTLGGDAGAIGAAALFHNIGG